MRSLSEEFVKLSKDCKNRSMNIRELMLFAGHRSAALSTAIFSIPFLFFIPLPGLSTILGLLVIFAGNSIAFNRPIWFPKFILKKKISGSLISSILRKTAAVLRRIEKVARPRGEFFHRHPFFQRMNGLLLIICGFLLMLPLPPGTNFPPGVTSLLISVGILEEDGLFIVIGYFAFLSTIFLFVFLPILGYREIQGSTH
ncbi:MAG: exopolysaccharide biosynthesis protein [Verrucomicrobia bacterium]|nr:exopolysaccharide biosynthesis protein [Verrucomicrobiota bacterium]